MAASVKAFNYAQAILTFLTHFIGSLSTVIDIRNVFLIHQYYGVRAVPEHYQHTYTVKIA